MKAARQVLTKKLPKNSKSKKSKKSKQSLIKFQPQLNQGTGSYPDPPQG